MADAIDTQIHMWFVLALTGVAMYMYAKEKFPIDVTSVLLLTALLLFGQIFPLADKEGHNLLDAASLLAGFANPALIAVLALLVMGQAIIHTDSLRPVIRLFVDSRFLHPYVSIAGVILLVTAFSAFLNNTPLVILAIPLLQAVAVKAGLSDSRVMMPLSFAAILGGMTTLVGSSTNLLVSNAMVDLGYQPLGFFEFAVPGMMLAGIGLLYCLLILPRLVPDRQSMSDELRGEEKKFIAELDIHEDSRLIGMTAADGKIAALADYDIRMVQRAGRVIPPPFTDYTVEEDDILIVAATREELVSLLSKFPGFLLSEEDEDDEEDIEVEQPPRAEEKPEGEEGAAEEEAEPVRPKELDERVAESRALAEIMINPASRYVDMTLDQAKFRENFGLTVLGVQRRARLLRKHLGNTLLEAGDVLLVAGTQGEINAVRDSTDFIVLSGSRRELPIPAKAPIAMLVFLMVVITASTGFLSIVVAALTGCVLLIATGCLNIRQATRAIDRKILVLVGSMLALGHAMQVTGGADYIADLLQYAPYADNPLVMVSLLFLLVAIVTNILSNNACAILFTPIAMGMATNLNVDPVIFAVAVVFAANCSFASPIGYKTNLLVMGPGRYRFMDFMKAGIPLVLLIWAAYIGIAKYYYGL